MKLPKYINCKTNEYPCEYLMHQKLCKNTCPYVRSLGIGAITEVPEKGLEDKMKKDKD